LYDAVYMASEDIVEREGRHVMVVVTDGGDTVSSKNFHDALEALHDADAIFYAILVMPVTNDPGRNVGGENALAGLAASTGGRVFHPSVGPGMNDAFDELLRELRTQYFLGFYPKNVPPTKERFHRIEVKTKRKNLRVISRSGYYGESEGSADTPPRRLRSGPP
ncbi:MAG: VWA domain-containing protein, partial [Bryobacteraceae bacterium]